MQLEAIAKKERNRLRKLIAEAPEPRQKALEPIIENTAWMKAKLDDAREKIKSTSVVIPYDNGGGQSGIRENPMFKGYEALWKSYLAGMEKIIAALPAEAAQEESANIKTAPSTVLEIVRAKHA